MLTACLKGVRWVLQEETGHEPVASSSGDAGTEEPAMTLEQFKEQLRELNKGLRSLPATAQVTHLPHLMPSPPSPPPPVSILLHWMLLHLVLLHSVSLSPPVAVLFLDGFATADWLLLIAIAV